VPIKAGPAMINNNLSSDGESVAYCTGKDVCFVKEKSFDGKSGSLLSYLNYGGAGSIYQVRFCVFGATKIVVVATSKAIEFYSEDSSKCILSHPIPDTEAQSYGEKYACGISPVTTSKGQQYIVVGTSGSKLFVFSVQRSLVSFDRTLEHKEGSVCVLASQEKIGDSRCDVFLSAHSNGSVILWNTADWCSSTACIGQNIPATSAAMWGDFELVGFADGHIVILSNGVKKAEVGGHAKAITAMAAHPEKALLATVSEDTYVTVWSLPVSGEVSVNTTTSVANSVLCGVQFCGKKRNELAVSFYDGDILCVWPGSL